jgi:hypothetical protein
MSNAPVDPASPAADFAASLVRLLAEDDRRRAGGHPLLTTDGLAYVQGELAAARGEPSGSARPTGLPRSGPHWDEVRRQLRLRGVLLKEFHRLAPAQTAILAAFERLGWPHGPIPDPLPPDRADSPADTRRHLQETVKNLNRGLPAEVLHFREEGGLVRCVWQWTDARPGPAE